MEAESVDEQTVLDQSKLWCNADAEMNQL